VKHVPPSTNETAFNCPHCGALAKQFWFRLYAERHSDEHPLPLLIEADREFDPALREADDEANKALEEFFNKMKSKLPFLDEHNGTLYSIPVLLNVNLSKCYNCKDISLWLNDRLIYPVKGEAPPPNVDLPADILSDYLEASAILDLSPRGAAALVRLCIQKLCKHLGQPGENINADIKALVAAGLDSRVQKALDAVRVIGNNAVHPGSMDLSDDRATAESLFKLLNLIAEKMISEPKHVDEVYASLPPGARAAIEARDKKP
jgi:hypothetical protein